MKLAIGRAPPPSNKIWIAIKSELIHENALMVLSCLICFDDSMKVFLCQFLRQIGLRVSPPVPCTEGMAIPSLSHGCTLHCPPKYLEFCLRRLNDLGLLRHTDTKNSRHVSQNHGIQVHQKCFNAVKPFLHRCPYSGRRAGDACLSGAVL
jgi:hypothetical protein